jgi:hypothetical protein
MAAQVGPLWPVTQQKGVQPEGEVWEATAAAKQPPLPTRTAAVVAAMPTALAAIHLQGLVLQG